MEKLDLTCAYCERLFTRYAFFERAATRRGRKTGPYCSNWCASQGVAIFFTRKVIMTLKPKKQREAALKADDTRWIAKNRRVTAAG